MRSTLKAVEGGIPHANFSFSSVLLFCGFKRWEKKCDFTFITAQSSSQAWAGWVLKLWVASGTRPSGRSTVSVRRSSNCKRKNNRFRVSPKEAFFSSSFSFASSFPTALTRALSLCIRSQHYHGMEYAISINGTEKMKLNRRIFIVLFYFLLLVFLDVPLPLGLLSAATLGWYESFAKGAQASAQLSFAFGVCFL